MQKFYYLFLTLLVFPNCLMSNQAIEECIKNLDQKTLREIVAHDLIMHCEDRDKYVTQIDAIIKQAQVFNQERRAAQPHGYSQMQWDRWKRCVFYNLCAILSIIELCGNISEQDTDKKKWQLFSVSWPIPAYFCYFAFKSCMNVMPSRIINNVLKKAITIRALLKNIPVSAN